MLPSLLVLAALALPAARAASPATEIDGVPLATAQAIFQIEVLRLPAASLAPWLRDPDPDVRRRVALALGRLRDPADGASMLAALAEDEDPTVRAEVAFALGQTPDTRARLELRWAEETDPDTRAALAVALGKQGGAATVDLLLAGLSAEDRVAAAAAEGLGRLAMRKVEGAAREEVARRLLDRLASPFGATHTRAAWALSRLGLTAATVDTRDRMRAIAERDPDPVVRAWLWRAWAGVTTDEERAAGLAVAARDDAEGVRVAAARMLARSCAASTDGALAALTRDRVEGVRLEAIASVGSCPGPNPSALLDAALKSGNPRERAAAVHALAGTGELPGGLSAYLGAEEPLAVRAAAIRAGTDRDRLLELALRAPEPPLRSAATETLLGLAPARPGDLARLLAASDPVVATAAADTLRETPDATTERALVARLAKGDLDDASAATFLRALARLYGTGSIREPAAEARTVLPRWLTLPGLAQEAARIAAVLRVPVPTPAHPVRRVPDLAEVLTIRSARLFTEEGEVRVRLRPDVAPYTVWNFAVLAERGFYDGVSWHRVVPDFVAQAGDPRGDGWGGPGWEIPDEVNHLPYAEGAVGMALSGPDTGGSQWFVTLSPQPHLDGAYTVFGEVTYGLRNARALDQGERITRVVIERVR